MFTLGEKAEVELIKNVQRHHVNAVIGNNLINLTGHIEDLHLNDPWIAAITIIFDGLHLFDTFKVENKLITVVEHCPTCLNQSSIIENRQNRLPNGRAAVLRKIRLSGPRQHSGVEQFKPLRLIVKNREPGLK